MFRQLMRRLGANWAAWLLEEQRVMGEQAPKELGEEIIFIGEMVPK
tara:strand:+ start:236 stop:373 length:138 start_codon:yes stop_codon:yes gene_type:complete